MIRLIGYFFGIGTMLALLAAAVVAIYVAIWPRSCLTTRSWPNTSHLSLPASTLPMAR